MKTYNEIQIQIEFLEKQLQFLEKQIKEAGEYTPIAKQIEKDYKMFENDIRTLKWVLS